MYCKGSITHTAARFEVHAFRSLALTTMLSKLTRQFRLLQHELILTYIFQKNKTSLLRAENERNWDSAAMLAFCQMTIKDFISKGDPRYGAPSPTTGKPSGSRKGFQPHPHCTVHKGTVATTTTGLSRTSAKQL